MKESEILKALRHSNIIQYLASGMAPNRVLWIAMDYVRVFFLPFHHPYPSRTPLRKRRQLAFRLQRDFRVGVHGGGAGHLARRL